MKKYQSPNRITNNSINNSGTINGSVTLINKGSSSTNNFQNSDVDKTLIEEMETVKSIVNSFSEINTQQKELLVSIIDDAKNTIEEGTKEKQQKKFKDAICLMGNAGSKLITALSGLTNVLRFFDISIT